MVSQRTINEHPKKDERGSTQPKGTKKILKTNAKQLIDLQQKLEFSTQQLPKTGKLCVHPTEKLTESSISHEANAFFLRRMSQDLVSIKDAGRRITLHKTLQDLLDDLTGLEQEEVFKLMSGVNSSVSEIHERIQEKIKTLIMMENVWAMFATATEDEIFTGQSRDGRLDAFVGFLGMLDDAMKEAVDKMRFETTK